MRKITNYGKYAAIVPLLLLSSCGNKINMPYGVTPISHDMYDLHMFIIYVCIGIAIFVYGLASYILFFHRKSRGAVASKTHGNTYLEILWTLIPVIILIIIAIPGTKVTAKIFNADKADINIKITGYQWKWRYEYLDYDIDFFSNLATPQDEILGKKVKDKWYLLEVDEPMVVPIHKKIRFLLTSNDVNHSWWVPDLGVKQDAIPGFINEKWAWIETPGIYRGQCTELCGVFHGFMPVVVKAVRQEEFDAWVKSHTKSPRNQDTAATDDKLDFPTIMERGKKVYDKYCVACHQADGKGIPPLFPALRGSSVAVGEPISRHIDIILHGVTGSAMQAFADQMTDDEIAYVVTYERNAWENNTGDIITPEEVAKGRRGSD